MASSIRREFTRGANDEVNSQWDPDRTGAADVLSEIVDNGRGGGLGPGSHAPNGDGAAGKKGGGRVTGMSKKFGKDSIGVSGDSIFEMVTRRYKANETALKK